jgi:dGTP triphosphohydrolase
MRPPCAGDLDPDQVGGYEGNAQTFRLVTARLTGHSDLPGLNLTRATLDAALKYPWARGEVSRAKWCFYPSERTRPSGCVMACRRSGGSSAASRRR